MHDPWSEEWRIEAASGVIAPGDMISPGPGWRVYLNTARRSQHLESYQPALLSKNRLFIVLARVVVDVDGAQLSGWDDVLLCECSTGRVGWWNIDPVNPESLVLVVKGTALRDRSG